MKFTAFFLTGDEFVLEGPVNLEPKNQHQQ